MQDAGKQDAVCGAERGLSRAWSTIDKLCKMENLQESMRMLIVTVIPHDWFIQVRG